MATVFRRKGKKKKRTERNKMADFFWNALKEAKNAEEDTKWTEVAVTVGRSRTQEVLFLRLSLTISATVWNAAHSSNTIALGFRLRVAMQKKVFNYRLQ